MLIDTHCHIHDEAYGFNIDEVMQRAQDKGVTKAICIGTSVSDSRLAIRCASGRSDIFAAVGVHPHEVNEGYDIESLLLEDKVVAIGEIGLDYYYLNSPKVTQKEALKHQLKLAIQYNLPVVFHVRDAFDDFWPIFDSIITEYGQIKGVLHSFTDSEHNLEQALKRGLYVSVNGISTFTKDEVQKQVFASIPIDKLLLETDAPFLTPVPFRGKMNEPAYVSVIADYHAQLRGVSQELIAKATTANAKNLFSI